MGERWVVVRQQALDVGQGDDVRTGGRPELGYALLADAATFGSEDEARAALRGAGLPLGWVLLPLSRLLPDLYQKSQPAPAAEPVAWSENMVRARIEEAFREGYWARETYNDTEVSDADEKWEGAKVGLCTPPTDQARNGGEHG